MHAFHHEATFSQHSHSDDECVNSVQGHTFITDSEGTICLRHHVQANGCCGRAVAELSCEGCVSGCCPQFEYCLSCCLRGVQETERRELHKADFFQCLHACRTSSRSLRRGNLYRFASSPYCFDHNTTLQTPEGFSTLSVVSNLSQSCRAACATVGGRCHESLFPLVNGCSQLQQHFACGQCGETLAVQADPPSFIVPQAPQDLTAVRRQTPSKARWWEEWLPFQPSLPPSQLQALLPDSCLLGDRDSFDCEASHPFAQRLCPCFVPNSFYLTPA